MKTGDTPLQTICAESIPLLIRMEPATLSGITG